MKLISLNIWCGKAFDPLIKFIKKSANDTDIFCLQEVLTSQSGPVESRGARVNVLADIAEALPDFVWYFAPEGDGYDEDGPVEFEVSGGQATLLKKSTVSQYLISEGAIFTYKERKRLAGHETFEDLGASFQYVRLVINNKKFVICNLHGMPYPGDKKDTEDRLRQSQIINDFLKNEDGAKILCGDFNLMPDTQSIKMFEENLINLITRFNIERTRSKLHPFYGKKEEFKICDYTFVSPEVNVLNFSVPDIAVSDHLPLVLEFS